MAADAKIAAIVLAAGNSTRMGSPKALLPFEQSTFIDTILERLTAANCQPLITVLGAEGELICRSTMVDTYHCVSNPAPQEGMLSSLKIAIRELPPDCTGFIMALVDHPNVAPDTYRQLSEMARRHPDAIVIPRFLGRNGHPVYFGRPFFKQLLDTDNQYGAQIVVRRSQSMVRFLEVDDAGILQDINTPQAYVQIARG